MKMKMGGNESKNSLLISFKEYFFLRIKVAENKALVKLSLAKKKSANSRDCKVSEPQTSAAELSTQAREEEKDLIKFVSWNVITYSI